MTPPARIDTVVFDVGNVLIHWDPRHLFRKLLPDDAAVEDFLATVCTMEWNIAQDAGRTWTDGVATLTDRFPDKADLIRAYDERWMETVPDAIWSSVEVLKALKAAGVPVFGITNFSAEKWADTNERFDFFSVFDGVVVSAHERVIKPDPEIYRICFERYDIDPLRAVFIDDSPKNVAASEALGMRAIRFDETVDLGATLRTLGLRF